MSYSHDEGLERVCGIKLEIITIPPKKRAPQDSTGAEPASKTQRQDDNGEGPSTRSEPEQANGSQSDSGDHAEGPNQDGEVDPYKYTCMIIPQWADKNDDETRGVPVHSKPASEHPEWKWVVMHETWMIMTEWHLRMADENQLVRFHDEFSKKQKSIEAMWTFISGMLHWRLIENSNWECHDDGRKESATWGLSGCAILTMFNELDRAGHLKPDSKFQYLGLIMGMALKWSQDQEDYELEDIEWRNSVVAYAKKGGIDLADIPLDDVEKLMDGIEHVEIPAHVKADQWEFKKKYKDFEARHGAKKRASEKPAEGGTHYDITRPSSEERASYNFDHEDPLPSDIPDGAFLEIRRG
ncbi:hypothetical protein Q7P35_002083 [Cladosporium inversicolor]